MWVELEGKKDTHKNKREVSGATIRLVKKKYQANAAKEQNRKLEEQGQLIISDITAGFPTRTGHAKTNDGDEPLLLLRRLLGYRLLGRRLQLSDKLRQSHIFFNLQKKISNHNTSG